MKNKKDERFKYRFGFSFLREYKKLKEYEKIYPVSKKLKKEEKNRFCLTIKRAYDYAWKTMKDYLKLQGIECYLPRIVVSHYEKSFDTTSWISFIDYCSNFLENPDETGMDDFISNYYSIYKKAFKEFYEYFSSKMKEEYPNKLKFETQPHSNNYMLDSYVFWLLIDYFKKHHKIHIVRLYGSRAENSYRLSSDIDLFIGGSFTQEDFIKFSKELNALRHPFFIDLLSLNDADKKGYIKKNIETSIIIYDKRDFF